MLIACIDNIVAEQCEILFLEYKLLCAGFSQHAAVNLH